MSTIFGALTDPITGQYVTTQSNQLVPRPGEFEQVKKAEGRRTTKEVNQGLRKFNPKKDAEPKGGPKLGRYSVTTPEGQVVSRSARLNPEIVASDDAAVVEAAAAEVPDDNAVAEVTAELAKLGIGSMGGRRGQRGGAYSKEEAIGIAKAIVQMSLYNARAVAGEVAKPTAKYLNDEIAQPLLGPLGRVAGIGLSLANAVLVRTPVTFVMGSVASVGYIANVALKVVEKFNTWGRATSATLLSDDTAIAAANAAVAGAKEIATTGVVGVAVANQLGVLPLSAVLAAILFSLKLQVGTGPGRAYLISSFYTWYVAQSPAAKKEIKRNAEEYAGKAQAAAKSGAAAVQAATSAAAAKLGPKLAAVGAAGANAFKTVADAIRSKEAPAAAAAPAAVEAGGAAEAVAALNRGAPVAAAVVEQVGVVAPSTGGTQGGRRRKTAKRALKKARATRRRKAPKYLAAPIVGRKGVFAY